MVSTTSDPPSSADRSTRDRSAARRSPDRRPRIDQSVFAAMTAVSWPITVATFLAWFACFASAGREQ